MNAFDMMAPDGQPVRWAINLLHRTGLAGSRARGGPDLPPLPPRGRRGSARLSLRKLAGGAGGLPCRPESQHPGLRVAGAESPPFRPLTPEEDQQTVERINASGAGILLVGLGCPKQDLFAYEHRQRIRPVQVCVGAVFDFHAGHKRMAPPWMQRHGLEWLFRLCQEPRRLWRRYLIFNTVFLLLLAGALLRRRQRRPTRSRLPPPRPSGLPAILAVSDSAAKWYHKGRRREKPRPCRRHWERNRSQGCPVESLTLALLFSSVICGIIGGFVGSAYAPGFGFLLGFLFGPLGVLYRLSN